MNQKQRDFLIARVNKTHKNQINAVQKDMPDKPSLNNYLVAAFLDNSIQFNDIELLKEKMRNTVLKYGANDRLVEDEGSWRSTKEKNHVKIVPEDLFIIPDNYTEALREYKTKKQEIDKKCEILDAQMQTIEMKIQIGSDKVLSGLIDQADNLADLSLINSQLLLTS